MRVALFSDVHGNLPALEAVLADIDAESVDQVLCLGDLSTIGDRPRECLARVKALGCPVVMGNHDEFMIRPGLVREAYPQLPYVVERVEDAAGRMTDEDRAFIRSFEPRIDLALDADHRLMCFHGSPDSNAAMIFPSVSDDQLDALFEGHSATVFAGGHTHFQMTRRHRDALYVNVGSVGMPWKLPFDGWSDRPPSVASWAEYAIIGWRSGRLSVELRRIDF